MPFTDLIILNLHCIKCYLTFVSKDWLIILHEKHALLNIPSLYTVKYVSTINGAERHRMCDGDAQFILKDFHRLKLEATQKSAAR